MDVRLTLGQWTLVDAVSPPSVRLCIDNAEECRNNLEHFSHL